MRPHSANRKHGNIIRTVYCVRYTLPWWYTWVCRRQWNHGRYHLNCVLLCFYWITNDWKTKRTKKQRWRRRRNIWILEQFVSLSWNSKRICKIERCTLKASQTSIVSDWEQFKYTGIEIHAKTVCKFCHSMSLQFAAICCVCSTPQFSLFVLFDVRRVCNSIIQCSNFERSMLKIQLSFKKKTNVEMYLFKLFRLALHRVTSRSMNAGNIAHWPRP